MFDANLFNGSTQFGTQTFSSLNGVNSGNSQYGRTNVPLNTVLKSYNDNDCSTSPSNDPCSTIISDLSGIYNQIKTNINSDINQLRDDNGYNAEIKRKLNSMHSETGILASQNSDYMSVVMSSVLWTTLAGSLVVYLFIKTQK